MGLTTENIREQLRDESDALGPEMRELLSKASFLRERGEWESAQGWCYKIIETDVPVTGESNKLAVFRGPFSRIRAANYAWRMRPKIPSYSLRVGHPGRMRFEVGAFQNLLFTPKASRQEVRGVIGELMDG